MRSFERSNNDGCLSLFFFAEEEEEEEEGERNSGVIESITRSLIGGLFVC